MTSGRHPSIYLRGSIVALSIVALVWFDSSTASAGTVFVLEADEDVVTFENPDSENEATDLRLEPLPGTPDFLIEDIQAPTKLPSFGSKSGRLVVFLGEPGVSNSDASVSHANKITLRFTDWPAGSAFMVSFSYNNDANDLQDAEVWTKSNTSDVDPVNHELGAAGVIPADLSSIPASQFPTLSFGGFAILIALLLGSRWVRHRRTT